MSSLKVKFTPPLIDIRSVKPAMSAPPSPTLSDSAILDSLEDSEVLNLDIQREKRIEQLQAEVKKIQSLGSDADGGYGEVKTFKEEKRLVERIAKEPFVLIHFFHPDFHRCHIMDMRLSEIAPKYRHTLFVRASVADSLFLVAKFEVKVLPCVMSFVNGRCVDRMIGFEDLDNNDAFTAKALEFRLQQSGVLPTGPLNLSNALPTALTKKKAKDEDDDDSDEDRWGGKSGSRRGKTGIRNGFRTTRYDDDDDE